MFLFDQSFGHCAYADNALNVHKMMCHMVEKAFIRDTVWDAKPQKLVTAEGIQKGSKTLLEERSVNTTKLKKEDMIKIAEEMRNFKFKRPRLKK